MKAVCSEDSVRRAFLGVDENEVAQWQRRHLRAAWEPALALPWVLDIDTTIKPIYGHQEGATLGYNPHKPGRPSHAFHKWTAKRGRTLGGPSTRRSSRRDRGPLAGLSGRRHH